VTEIYQLVQETMEQPLLYFIENITLDGKRYTFSFREISVRSGRKFCVVTYMNHEAVVFEIKRDKYNNWKMVKPFPDWLIPYEKKLTDILKAHVI
jgi:hypothetical protein